MVVVVVVWPVPGSAREESMAHSAEGSLCSSWESQV